MDRMPPKSPDEVYVFDAKPDRPYRVLGDVYYDWTGDGIMTNADQALQQVRKKAAKLGADCVMQIQRETGLGPYSESTVRAKLCAFTGARVTGAQPNDTSGSGFRHDLVDTGTKWWCYAYEYGTVISRDRLGRETLDAESHYYSGDCSRTQKATLDA